MTRCIAPRLLFLVWAVALLWSGLPCSGQEANADAAQAVLRQFNEAYRTREWPRAVASGVRAARLMPNDSVVRYNLACAYALNGDPDKALGSLQEAARLGFSRVALLEMDADLDSIRGHAGYGAVLAAVEANQERGRVELREGFERRPPLVVLPPRYDHAWPAPLIIALHGYGGQARGMAEQWRDAAAEAGAILVVPQAVRPGPGGQGFNWVGVEEADYLVQLTLDFAKENYAIDEDQVVLTGFSQGGFIAYSVGVRHPEWFTGVIPIGAPYIASLDTPPEVSDGHGPRFYFMVGARDQVRRQSRQAADDFTAAGYQVKFLVYPGVGHSFPRNRDEELGKALGYVLGRD